MTAQLPPRAEPAGPDGEVVWPAWVYPYSAGIVGGLLGGAAVALVGLAYGLASGHTWLPVNAVAATVLRGLQTQTPQQLGAFNPTALVVGFTLHAGISVSLGMLFALLLPTLPGRALYWGPVIGPLLWVGATVAVLPVLNPVMAANVEWISFAVGNVLYGLILGWWIDRAPLMYVGR